MTHAIPDQPQFGEALPPQPSREVLAFLARRRSASAQTLAAPGPSAEEIADLLRLATRVPDHGKLAPWRFVLLEGEGKAAFAARLDGIANARGDVKAAAKLFKLKAPPMGIAVISRAAAGGEIPEWEQLMSAGAVCTLLLTAATAMGYGANWITDWYAYDEDAKAALGLADHERVAGFIFIGTPTEPPLERVRPEPDVTRL